MHKVKVKTQCSKKTPPTGSGVRDTHCCYSHVYADWTPDSVVLDCSAVVTQKSRQKEINNTRENTSQIPTLSSAVRSSSIKTRHSKCKNQTTFPRYCYVQFIKLSKQNRVSIGTHEGKTDHCKQWETKSNNNTKHSNKPCTTTDAKTNKNGTKYQTLFKPSPPSTKVTCTHTHSWQMLIVSIVML